MEHAVGTLLDLLAAGLSGELGAGPAPRFKCDC